MKYVEAEEEVSNLARTVIQEHFPEIDALDRDEDPLRIKIRRPPPGGVD